ncbi:translocation/assembly module TamB domain-containing protein [Mesonia aquimarina]|uniref:translocation/assembly module TamB domain-containing protein n=1 Tax=Mesonia aquimarina TaxID=1504967 RepID=UPI000EF62737|nr:translocation/assembly module TamB [Mesonia aquimarina]
MNKNKKQQENSKKKKVLKILGRTFLFFLLFLLLLVLFIRSPWGQDIIVSKITNYVSGKTNTKVEIEKLFITFSGDISLEGLYLEDKKGDTLVYSKSLEADIPLWPIIKGNAIGIDGVEWKGLKANIYRKDSLSGFNYQFLVDAFASDTTTTSKKTQTKPMEISVGDIEFSEFKINYSDQVSGMKANLALGNLFVEGKSIDLQKMDFHLREISLKNTSIFYVQSKTIASDSSETAALPSIKVDQLSLNKVEANYQDLPNQQFFGVNLQELGINKASLALEEQKVNLEEFILNNSEINIQLSVNEKEVEKDAAKKSTPFSWPDWAVQLDNIHLENNQICYQVNEENTTDGKLNPQALAFSDFTFKGSKISLEKNRTANLKIEEFSFVEASGFHLKELNFDANLTNQKFDLNNLNLKTNKSSLKTSISANYKSIETLIENPEKTDFSARINQFTIAPKEAYVFAPKLKNNEQFKALATHSFRGKLAIKGNLKSATINELSINWGEQTQLVTKGELKNITDPEKLQLQLKNYQLKTIKEDLTSFVSEKELGISVPEKINLKGTLSGSLQNFQTNSTLVTSDGNININGYFSNQEKIAFNSSVEVVELDLGKILQNPDIGKLSVSLETSGKGNTINSLDAKLNSQFSKLEYKGYDFSALKLDGDIKNGKGNVKLAFKDENLNFKLDSKVQLDSISPEAKVDLNLIGANLYALGITKKDIRTKVNLTANFKGNAEKFNLESSLTDGVAVYDDKPYYLGDLDIKSFVNKDSTALKVTSSFFNTNLNSNANPQEISRALRKHAQGYFKNLKLIDSTQIIDSIAKPVNLKMDVYFHETPIISDVFAEGLQEMDTLKATIDFSEQKNELTANVNLPYLNYQQNTVDSLQLDINSNGTLADFKLGFASINAGPVNLPTTSLEGKFENEKLQVAFKAYDKKEELFFVKSELVNKNEAVVFHLDSEKLIINKNGWSIPASNKIRFVENQPNFEDFVFSRNSQEVNFSNNLKQEAAHWGVQFSNFQLGSFMSYFSTDEKLASGEVNGNFIIVNPTAAWGMLADLSIDNFKVTEVPLGQLKLEAKSSGLEKYDVNLALKGEGVDADFTGNYKISTEGPQLDLDLVINEIKLATVEKFLKEELNNSEGSIAAKINVSGTPTEPNYKGYFSFNNATFKVKRLNSKFSIADERINIDNKGVYFNSFAVADSTGNKFTVNGDVLTEDLTNPKFKLDVKATDFLALNSSKEDNDLYFGKAIFDVDAKIRGDLSFPEVNVDLTVDEKTDVTYVIPETQLSIEERDGIVTFVNKENPDNILTKNSSEDGTAIITGIELKTKLKIEPKATFRVLINERTGDNLKLTGGGELRFNINRNGRTNLTGRYNIDNGHYEMNLYGLVKRKFDLAPSSNVKWQGDPMNAELDIKAIYKVETSASALMSSSASGASELVKNQYRQKLPFLVYLNVDGQLMQPRLNFSLDMPESEQGAVSGTVYGKINQINQQVDQLNKQVFSLLVLNRFYPEAGSDGSQGGVATMARNNLNQALTDQLNMFSDKLTGNTGIELNFGVNSYTDYQGTSAQERTDVAVNAQKKLLNDRLIVKAGSEVNVQGDNRPGETNPVIGNFSIEYLLTENGRWRINGFRQSEYENVIDGQVFISGIALIFTREFNKFKELWNGEMEAEKQTENNEQEENPSKEKDGHTEVNKKADNREKEEEDTE